MPGDRERAVQLNADHSTICKFGPSQPDQDNLKLVQSSIKGLYKGALEKCELIAIPSIIGKEGMVTMEDDVLEARLAKLKGNDTVTIGGRTSCANR